MRVVFFGLGISVSLTLFLCLLGLIIVGSFGLGWLLK